MKTNAEPDQPQEKNKSFGRNIHDAFNKAARKTSNVVGSAWTFMLALAIILVWALTGPAAHYSDTWQLIINTSTTIITFLMVFLIQNTQNRDSKAAHLKLDELIRAVQGARNNLVDLEKMSDEQLAKLENEFERIRQRAEKQPREQGASETAEN